MSEATILTDRFDRALLYAAHVQFAAQMRRSADARRAVGQFPGIGLGVGD
jgi:hypothetical protein